MATCNVVFGGLTLVRRAPFGPSAGVSGDITNITAVPAKGYPASMGSVTSDLKFNSLGRDAGDGDVSGLVRLNLVLGVDKDCDLATGDTDGVDGSTRAPPAPPCRPGGLGPRGRYERSSARTCSPLSDGPASDPEARIFPY